MRLHGFDDLPLNSVRFLRELPEDSVLAQRTRGLAHAFTAWADAHEADPTVAMRDRLTHEQLNDAVSVLRLSRVARIFDWATRVMERPMGSLRFVIESQGPEEGRWFDPKIYGLPGLKSMEIRRTKEVPQYVRKSDALPAGVSLVSRPPPRVRSVPLREYFDPRFLDLAYVQPALVIAAAHEAPGALAETLSKAALIIHCNHPAGDAEAVAWMLERLGLDLHELDLQANEVCDNVLLALPGRVLTADDIVAARDEVEAALADLLFPLGELRSPVALLSSSHAEWNRRAFIDGSAISEAGVYIGTGGESVPLVDDAEEMQTLTGRLEAMRAALLYRAQHRSVAPAAAARVRPFDLGGEMARRTLMPPTPAFARGMSEGAAADGHGRIPLHYLAYQDDPAAVLPHWMALGLDLNAKDNDGRTPLEVALWRNAIRVATHLLRSGVRVEGITRCGRDLKAWTETWIDRIHDEIEEWSRMHTARHSAKRRARFAPFDDNAKLSLSPTTEQLGPFSPKPAKERARSIPLFAWAGLLPLSRRDEALAAVQRWAEDKGDFRLTDLMASDARSTDAAFQSSADLESGLWAARFTKDVDAGQSYRTEFVFFPRDEHLCVGVRLVYLSKAGVTPDPNPSIPAIVQKLAALDARDAGLALRDPLPVRTAGEGEAFARVLLSPDRNTSVLLVASDTRGAAERAVPQRLIGACGVVFADHDALEGLCDALPASARLPDEGAWRLYPPHYGALLKLGQDSSYPIDAPLESTEAVLRRRLVTHLCRFSSEDAEAFEVPTYIELRKVIAQRATERAAKARALARDAARTVVAQTEPPSAPAAPQAPEAPANAAEHAVKEESAVYRTPEQVPVEDRARELLAEVQRAVVEELQLEVQALQDELTRAQNEIAELKDIVALGDEELAEKEDELKRAQETNTRLRAKLAQQAATVHASDAATEGYPDDFDELEDWVLRRFPETLVLASKALREARASQLAPDVVQQAYGALELLATAYLDSRAGVAGAQERFLERMKDLRIDCGPVGVAMEHRVYRDAYRAQVDGRTYTTDMHVQGSSTRDPTRCLRIYFHFDEARGRIIVGHLPTHLDNTLS